MENHGGRMTTDALIEKLEAARIEVKARNSALEDSQKLGFTKAIDIVRKHEADIQIVNDRVCIAGKWYVPAVTEGDPLRAFQEEWARQMEKRYPHLCERKATNEPTTPPDNVDRVAIALCSWLFGPRREPEEVWAMIPDHLKDQYRDQARSAIAAMHEIQVVEIDKLYSELTEIAWAHADNQPVSMVDNIMDVIGPYLRTTEPVSLERCARAINDATVKWNRAHAPDEMSGIRQAQAKAVLLTAAQ
jgi:hypothetical protein